MSLQLAAQPCAAWGRTPPSPIHSRGPPTLQLVSQQEQVEISAHGCSGTKNAVSVRAQLCAFLDFKARGRAWGCCCIKAKKLLRWETQVHTDTWASGHAADRNWTLSQSQEVKSKMEGMGCVLANRARNQTQSASGPFLLLGTLALGFMAPGLGGCNPPHLATPRHGGMVA